MAKTSNVHILDQNHMENHKFQLDEAVKNWVFSSLFYHVFQ